MNLLDPFQKLIGWLELENRLAATDQTYYAVLATATREGIPHSRIVVIREITSNGMLFFTQRNTKKVKELNENPLASMTFWCAKQNREVVVDGAIEALTEKENQFYWQSLPRERQLRFMTYAATSTQPISSISELEARQEALTKQFSNQDIPMSEFYCGFRLQPKTFCFYTLGQQTFSEIIRFSLNNDIWQEQLLSP